MLRRNLAVGMTLLMAAGMLLTSGCKRAPENAPNGTSPVAEHGPARASQPSGHDTPADAEAEHVHVAPHGGLLLEIGPHIANIELVRDSAEGRLTLYVLGPHAEVAVPILQYEVVIELRPGRDAQSAAAGSVLYELRLDPVENPLTGETAGHTSQFTAVSEILQGDAPLRGLIKQIAIKDLDLSDIPFVLNAAP